MLATALRSWCQSTPHLLARGVATGGGQLAVITDPADLRYNIVTLVGNVCRDPIMRGTASGPTVEIVIAQNVTKRRPDGTREEKPPHFFTCVANYALAHTIMDEVRTGTRVQLEGRLLQMREPRDAEAARRAEGTEGGAERSAGSGPSNLCCKVFVTHLALVKVPPRYRDGQVQGLPQGQGQGLGQGPDMLPPGRQQTAATF